MDRLRRNNVISGNQHDQRDAGGVEVGGVPRSCLPVIILLDAFRFAA
jgi:hypothetical protein